MSVARRDRPAGNRLRWDLARGDVPLAAVRQAIVSEADEDGQEEVQWTTKGGKPKSPFLPWKVPRRPQSAGTISKNVFEWKRSVKGDTYNLAIIANAVRPAHAEDQQRFAVVVTLECDDTNVNVYQAVRARLSAGRVRVPVRSRS